MIYLKSKILPLLGATVFGLFALTGAHAESGYRVCAILKEGNGANLSKGLITKVSKDNGGDACGRKIDFMTKYYSNAYPGQNASGSIIKMVTCEDFSGTIGLKVDMCKSMQVNQIYRYHTSTNESNTSNGNLSFWHN